MDAPKKGSSRSRAAISADCSLTGPRSGWRASAMPTSTNVYFQVHHLLPVTYFIPLKEVSVALNRKDLAADMRRYASTCAETETLCDE